MPCTRSRYLPVASLIPVALFALLAAGPGAAHAQVLQAAGGQSIADVTAKALPSVVNISTTKRVRRGPFHADPFFRHPFSPFDGKNQRRYARSLGSGVIVSTSGYVLTNNHVIANAASIRVKLSNGKQLTAKLVGADSKSDLAVLKLQGKLPPLTPVSWGASAKMRLGDVVLAIGNPFGVGQTVTMGIVSAKGRANMGIVDYEDFIQTDAAINPGNSGGALINMKGELVGINTAMLSRSGGYQGIGFAIPSDMARPIMTSLIKNGRVDRGWLGVSIQTYDDDLMRNLKLGNVRGVLIADVMRGSPAAAAGLRRNDIVVSLNGAKMHEASRFRNQIALAGSGHTVSLGVYRNQRNLGTVRVNLGRLPGKPQFARSGRGTGTLLRSGIQVRSLDRVMRQRYRLPRTLSTGVVVTAVSRTSPAALIGLRSGDVILEVNRKRVRTPAEFIQRYRSSTGTVALLVYRYGTAFYVTMSK